MIYSKNLTFADVMKDYGLVSIITPVYNCRRFLAETIESILNQSYTHWEMILVDDASTDGSQDIADLYARRDSRIKCHFLKTNSGTAVARNVAMDLAVGKYIAFLDSDDLWMPDKLEEQLEFMESNGYVFSCTSYEQIDESSKPIGKVIKSISKTNYRRMLLDCPVGNSTVIYNVSVLGKFKVPDIRKRNDDALWLQMLKKERYLWGLDKVLMQYRIRHDSVSADKWTLVKYHWKLYRRIEHLNLFSSTFHILYWGFLKVFRIK